MAWNWDDAKHHKVNHTVSWGFPAFLAYIGAAVYFIGQTTGGFWVVVLALLKAAVWPAFVVYHVLRVLGA